MSPSQSCTSPPLYPSVLTPETTSTYHPSPIRPVSTTAWTSVTPDASSTLDTYLQWAWLQLIVRLYYGKGRRRYPPPVTLPLPIASARMGYHHPPSLPLQGFCTINLWDHPVAESSQKPPSERCHHPHIWHHTTEPPEPPPHKFSPRSGHPLPSCSTTWIGVPTSVAPSEGFLSPPERSCPTPIGLSQGTWSRWMRRGGYRRLWFPYLSLPAPLPPQNPASRFRMLRAMCDTNMSHLG